MSYKSKLKIPLMLEEEKMKKVQEELHQLNLVRENIEQQIKKEEGKVNDLLSELMKGGSVSSSFFSGSYDRHFVLKKQKELEDIKSLIRVKNSVHQEIKKKIEKMNEIDASRKKEYEAEKEKKEQREAEELRSMIKHFQTGGD